MNVDDAYLKRVEMKDKDLLLGWANDDEVRKYSFNHVNISYEEHEQWFLNKLKDENCLRYLYIYKDTPVGQIRLDIDGMQAWINYSIDKNYRQQGHGKKMLSLVEDILLREKPSIKYLYAKVMKLNMVSQKIFEQQKYHRVEREDYIEYMKSL